MVIKNSSWINCYETVIGKTHIKFNIKNQDAILSKSITDEILISSVADGHGSKKCFRSDLGSKYAVEASIEIAEMIGEEFSLDNNEINIKKIGKFYINKVVSLWRKKVKENLDNNFIDFENINNLSLKEIDEIKENKFIVYGSTLLIVIVVKNFIICYQLGDGDILFVSKSGKVSKPINRDERHIANETLSLCTGNPEQEFKIKVFRDLKHLLNMIIISTDGYSNSFSSENGFLKVGSDLAEILVNEDYNVIAENLEDWIEDTSNNGSGDDISASVIIRTKVNEELDVD